MRTNIQIDDELMTAAMRAGGFKTKRETVEAGLQLLTRQAAYREILKWEGKLEWEGDESMDWTRPGPDESHREAPERADAVDLAVQEQAGRYRVSGAHPKSEARPVARAGVPRRGRR